jgi:outer membrane immunogenic protein
MNRLRLSLGSVFAALLLMVAGTPAFADGTRGMKDTPAAFSWTGFYVGTSVGIATGQTTADLGLGGGLFNTDYELSGSIYGIQVGYNWQSGPMVIGIEASYSGTTIQGTTTCILILECKREIESIGTVAGRFGLAVDKTLYYVLGGVAWGKVNSDVSIVGINIASDSQDHVGWIAGIGFEHALTKNITLRIEYSHIDLGTEQHFGFADVDVVLDTIRLGVNYKF